MSIKTVSVRVLVTALLAGAGWVCWTTGGLQSRLAEANGLMIMLQYEGSLGDYDDIEQSLGYLEQVPARLTPVVGSLEESRATALYWNKRYGALSLARDATGELVETNPDILFLAANALYRAGHRADGDRIAAVGALDAAIAGYADVLRKAPGHIDAAYNYEFAVRARVAAARVQETPRNRPNRSAQASAAGEDTARPHDLPAGPTMHGKPGAPPPLEQNSKFRVLVPMQPEERQGDPNQAGGTARRVRRG
jgi:hypothetical protein